MDPTALVTFLFKAPREAYSVELFGSWDNFHQAYRMQHDRRRGTQFWSGCFKFDNIIFDGDSQNWTKPRTGGLKQGGTYWYFYRLNDEVEAYDDSQQYTTTCPLLPGQRLNVIEVPTEIQDPPTRARSASGNAVDELANASSSHTLDPAGKFAPLEPLPVSKVHGRCISDLALGGRLESKPHSPKPKLPPLVIPPQDAAIPYAGQKRGRYYANEACAYASENRSPSESCFSGTSSCGDSSILDIYGEPASQLSPLFEASAASSRASSISPHKEDVPVGLATTNDFIDFDAEHQRYRDDTADDESDGEEDTDSATRYPEFLFSDLPARPTSSHGRTASHNAGLFPCPEVKSQQHDAGLPSPSPLRQHTSNSEPVSGPWDVLSPTFSAATLSSAGLITPFGLSVGCSRTTSVQNGGFGDDEKSPEVSIMDVTERLRQLKSSSSANDAVHSPPFRRTMGYFDGYALPVPHEETATAMTKHSDIPNIAMTENEDQVLGFGLQLSLPLPSLLQDINESGMSFADGVFGELGFLA